jgi:hypothetical protein
MIIKETITRGRVEAVLTALGKLVVQEILVTQRFKVKPLGVMVKLDDAKLLLAHCRSYAGAIRCCCGVAR